jgi:hypothetical protein
VTLVYLGWPGSYGDAIFRDYEPKHPLHLLVSFAYIDEWRKELAAGVWPEEYVDQTMLDSGAFTAYTTGRTIDREALMQEQRSSRWSECVALDAIGDPAQGEENWRASLDRGIDAFPTFHHGEPWEVLERYVRQSWKVGIGGVVGKPKTQLIDFYNEVFKRAWPARLHMFGSIDERVMRRYPWHSCDSAVWYLLSVRYAGWSLPSGKHLTYKGPDVATRIPQARYKIDVYTERGRRMAARWRKALAEVERKAPPRPSGDG